MFAQVHRCMLCCCRFLQSKLQTQCPAIDLTAFTAVANAAVDVSSSQTYNALTPQFTVEGSPMNIFLAAFFLEDVGVAMYQGLIPSIQSQDLRAAVTGVGSIPNCMLSSPTVWSNAITVNSLGFRVYRQQDTAGF